MENAATKDAAQATRADKIFQHLCDKCPPKSPEDARSFFDILLASGTDPMVILVSLDRHCSILEDHLHSNCWTWKKLFLHSDILKWENVRVITGRANKLKNDATAEELRRIADHIEQAHSISFMITHNLATSFRDIRESWWRRNGVRRRIVGVLNASTSPSKEW
jgi:hypothetical protein